MTTFKPSESLAGPEIGDLTMAPDTIAVPLGWRVLVVGDLLLPAEATASSTAIASELAQVAETWEGPGLFVLSGRLFDVSTGPTRLLEARRALEAHPRLRFALESFAARDDGRLVHQGGQVDGTTEPASLLAGLESFGAPDLLVATGEGSRRVRIGHEGTPWDPGSPGDGATREEISPWLNAPVDAPWLEGINRLGDPARSNRFVVSRTLYRRIGRHLWWLGVPFLVALVVRIAITPWVANHVGGSAAGRALIRAHRADGVDQLQVALGVAAVAAVVMLVVVGLLSRRLWSTLGGGAIGDRIPGTTINDLQRDQARVLMAHGYQGYITAIGFDPEYTSLYPGFFVNLGASAEVVREHRARFGLPPVFLHSEQVCWVEIGAGAELHLSLMLGRTDVPAGTRLERTVAIPPARLTSADEVPRLPGGTVLDPHEVASYPSGALASNVEADSVGYESEFLCKLNKVGGHIGLTSELAGKRPVGGFGTFGKYAEENLRLRCGLGNVAKIGFGVGGEKPHTAVVCLADMSGLFYCIAVADAVGRNAERQNFVELVNRSDVEAASEFIK